MLGAGNGTFAAKTDFAVGANPIGLTTGDLDRDGDLDLAVTAQAPSNAVSVLVNNGSGSFGSD